jgi:hypothetical protein
MPIKPDPSSSAFIEPPARTPAPAMLTPLEEPLGVPLTRPRGEAPTRDDLPAVRNALRLDEVTSERTDSFEPATKPRPSVSSETFDAPPTVTDNASMARAKAAMGGSHGDDEATKLRETDPKLLSMLKSASAAVVTLETPVPADVEEAEYEAVFKEFMETKRRCGEPTEGVTFDKFATKLRQNREQLIARYACKSVKFQVYVKDGKAALKATPVSR